MGVIKIKQMLRIAFTAAALAASTSATQLTTSAEAEDYSDWINAFDSINYGLDRKRISVEDFETTLRDCYDYSTGTPSENEKCVTELEYYMPLFELVMTQMDKDNSGEIGKVEFKD